ncbi:class I SAM-dependent methyltransferase [Pelagibius sp. Alg239-R121]|uniref:class I SAM-dependent methyltransferase n=1 Tax=Pelagibius sp. Alg239-R121 TaxID=2993448 RepID=UPI0024A7551E|nr:class I SAM-dependent methyltransferase [Pelagibius sp. Alg239-R121]
MTTVTNIIAQNRKAWNEVAPRHAELALEEVKRSLAEVRGAYVRPELREALKQIDLTNKTVVQFNCNNARELISLVQLGAARGVGFDFSEEFVLQARELVALSGLEIEIVETDIYLIGSDYEEIADVLVATSGALCWMGDLQQYFRIVRNVLKPDGILTIHETHPFLEMFKLDRECKQDEPLVPHYSYFSDEPVASDKGLDYYSNQVYGSETVYWYHHSFSSILQAVIDAGLKIEYIRELETDLDSGYSRVGELNIKPPMSYILMARRTD